MSYEARDRGRIRPAPAPGYAGPMQDPNYKRLFSFPRMVEDLLRGFLPGQWLAELDFSTLDKLPTEYVSDELLRRHGDCVWRVRRCGGWLYLLVLLEFQSTDEPRMALRILTYTSLLYQELVRNDALASNGPHIKQLKGLGLRFILGAKRAGHEALFEWVDATQRLKPSAVAHVEHSDEGGVHHRFRYLDGVPLNETPFELEVNFAGVLGAPARWAGAALRVGHRPAYR